MCVCERERATRERYERESLSQPGDLLRRYVLFLYLFFPTFCNVGQRPAPSRPIPLLAVSSNTLFRVMQSSSSSYCSFSSSTTSYKL